MTIELGTITNKYNERIDYTLHEGDEGCPHIVVIGHGVTGNKDRPFVVVLAEALAAKGLHALRFSFAGNGESEGDFRDCTISKEVDDLGAVLDALDGFKVTYIGHSMGGTVGVLRAAQDERIETLVSLAGMVFTAQFAQTEFGEVTPDEGFMWDDEECPLSKAYVDDLTQMGNVLPQAGAIKQPWLIVHGMEDDVVPPKDTKAILEDTNASPDVEWLEGANHVFADDALEPMVQTVLEWLIDQF